MIVSTSLLPTFSAPPDRPEPARPADTTDRRDAITRDATTSDVATRAAAARRASARSAAARKTVSNADDTTATDGTDAKKRVLQRTRPEFAAMLAVLNSVDPAARADAMLALPAGDASLIDRLLNGEGATDRAAAMDALRYGLMQDSARDAATASPDATTLSVLASRRRDAQRLPTSAPSTLGGVDSNARASSSNPSSAAQIALRALARAANTRGSREAELLAVGDTAGATARAALDRVLASAGTPEGTLLANGAMNAAMAAAAVAVANAHAAAATDGAEGTAPGRAPATLSAELRTRLDRVIARMRDEYGSDVSIVETTRSQERQDYLFAQGRTRPGDVVTWTHDSAHTRGEAVDVMVDGSYKNAEGFARLQRIAREEGLRTLGVIDPGHLELKRDARGPVTTATINAAVSRATVQPAAAPGATAAPAGVATVAQVASVARVADRATSNAGSSAGRGDDLNGRAPDAAPGAYAPLAGSRESEDRGASRDQRDAANRNATDRDARTDGAERGPRRSRTDAANTTAGVGPWQANNADSPAHTAAADAPALVPGSAAADRVASVQQLQSDAPAGTMSRMTLDVDGPNGAQRITVDLRGTNVGTHITTDSESADGLRLRTAELQDALGRHGLTSDSVRISTTPKTDPNAAVRAGDADAIGLSLGATTPSHAGEQSNGQGTPRDRAGAREWEREFQRQDDARKARDDQRQNAGQRGQRGTSNQDTR